MRLFFWIVAAVALVAAAAGWTSLDPPSLQDVPGVVISDWYHQQMIWALLIGAIAGGIGGWLATRQVRARPRQHADAFLSRVAARGLWTALAAGLVVAGVSAFLAYSYASVPVSPMDRIGLLLGAGRFVAVLGLGVFAATVAFAAVARGVSWTGRYALQNL